MKQQAALQKTEWFEARANNRANGITDTYKRQPDWKKKEKDLIAAITAPERDVVRENMLILANLGFLYLDFVDACRGGFSARVEKCIECFAVLFQGSKFGNYAAECMHFVACLKKVWKPEFK